MRNKASGLARCGGGGARRIAPVAISPEADLGWEAGLGRRDSRASHRGQRRGELGLQIQGDQVSGWEARRGQYIELFADMEEESGD